MEFNRPISPLPTPHAATSPFAVLRAAASRLPLSVPLAQSSDMIIKFSGDPAAEFETGNYDSAWEMADPMLNAILGKSVTDVTIADFIRRGVMGVNGLIDWMEALVNRLGVDVQLLEGKMGRLKAAMEFL